MIRKIFNVLVACNKFITSKQTETKHGNKLIKVPDQDKECVLPFMNPLTQEKSFECNRPDGFCINCFYCGTRNDPNESSGWGLCNCEKPDHGKRCCYASYIYISNKNYI